MTRFIAVVALASLAACTQTQKAVTDGQLFCARATQDGPLVVALTTALGVPFVVTNKTSTVVADACAAIDAVPVSPPANPATAPVVAAPGV